MSIPNSITSLKTGVIGTFAYDGPTRVQTKTLASATSADNVYGRAFFHTSADPEKVTATTNTGLLFAGVLVNPHQGAIGATYAENGTAGELCTMGEVLCRVKKGDAAPALGSVVHALKTTGELYTSIAGGTPTQLIKGATIVRHAPVASGVTDEYICVVAFNSPTA